MLKTAAFKRKRRSSKVVRKPASNESTDSGFATCCAITGETAMNWNAPDLNPEV
jgi:hypothetical protein